MLGFPLGSVGKASACNAGDTEDAGSITRSGRLPGRGHGNPLQYACLENSMDRGDWHTAVHGSQTHTHRHTHRVRYKLVTGQQKTQQSIVYMCQSQIPSPPTAFLFGIHVCSLHLCLYFNLANQIIYAAFLDSTYMHYYIYFSFTDLLHSVWHSLCPSISLQMTQFCSKLMAKCFSYPSRRQVSIKH